MKRRNIGEIVGAVVLSAVTVAAGAFGIDWLKSKGRWPGHSKQLPVSPEKDPVVMAGEKLL